MTFDAPERLDQILIVGGGTAGWLTASFLARSLGTDATGGPTITLLESPDIPTVGVGEGSFPSIRGLLRYLGVDEAEFVQATDATFKQGIRFDDWSIVPGSDRAHSYFHPFDTPATDGNGLSLVRHWLNQPHNVRRDFADALTFQKTVADAQLSPKLPYQGAYESLLTYAYHFDAGKLGAFLSRYAKLKGVRHVQARVAHVALAEDGSISCVKTDRDESISADLFIDCTGFRSELLGKALGTPFHSVKDILLTDRAVACQVPYSNSSASIPSYTISTAQEAGWIWDIALSSRRGVGYVYSSQYSTDDHARMVLERYTGAQKLETRTLAFEPGYRTAHWVKNCIGVGLSAGFVEPLEATGLVLIEAAVFKIAELLTFRPPYDQSAAIFNDQMVRKYEKIVQFLKLHFCLSNRLEPFWVENARRAATPEPLRNMLKVWKERPPSRFDFIEDYETFAFTSYQYILYGMNFETAMLPEDLRLPDREAAQKTFDDVVLKANKYARELPSHRNIIDQISRTGFEQVAHRAYGGANRLSADRSPSPKST